ncbi:TBC1 domain family member 1 isoform X2 [Ornithorhynchus anatinus]|uniref:TBC1 domain family member 1 isoform X2 n=1 Tax=Ornithorhynchus anatinus TaxID=9258 RepID=UPI0010A930C1|nr:TBC1 domain family member 1 isoform X2 [Ornithorhynchus anatinus]
MEPITFTARRPAGTVAGEVLAEFRLELVGSLPVHPLTTTPILPWVVAEVRGLRPRPPGPSGPGAHRIRLLVSGSGLKGEPDPGASRQWDPLICSSVFEHKPQHVHKLIHNSHDPSYFACLIKDHADTPRQSICYVFRADDQTKVPEIIGSIRQAGKIARQEEFHSPSEFDDTFAKKFEVLFCGRVTVAHKKAPPALIDECIEKFNHISCSRKAESDSTSRSLQASNSSEGLSLSEKFRSAFQSGNGEEGDRRPIRKSCSQPGLRSLAFKKEFQDGSHRTSSLFRSFEGNDIESHLLGGHNIVQPTDIEENRTMLFTIGQSAVFLISPDTKKVALEKSFKEISFCSQGISHVDHFGFICRESSGSGGIHFVCYVFQCTNEALVDEIMMTLKQAFTVAAVQQTCRGPAQLCEDCPMQSLHRLCEKIDGLPSSKTKLELQRHLTTLNNQEQALIFEEVQAAAESTGQELGSPGPRFRLDMLKNKAKRSLTESLESILSRGNKARGPREPTGPVDRDICVASTLISTDKEPPGGESEPLHPPDSPFEAAGLADDSAATAPETPPTGDTAQASQQGFRRRANTLSHIPVDRWKSSDATETPPGLPQRKLLRYHSVSTETPHERNLNPPISEAETWPDQSSTPSPPPGLTPCTSSSNLFKSLRPAPSGEQSSPVAPKSISYRSALRKKLHSSSSVPNFLKFLAPVDENSTSDFRTSQSDVGSKTKLPEGGDGESPARPRRHSWRQQIFLRVATPQKGCDTPSRYEEYADLGDLPPRSPLQPVREDGPPREAAARQRTPQELRELWHKAILQQILLLRMEKENRKLQASENDLLNRRLKLDYEEITPCLKDATATWESMLSTPGRARIKFEAERLHCAVGQGVPRQHRGEVWKFLAEQQQLEPPLFSKQQPKDTPYKELLKQLTSQQHAILIDLGRTFPTHPYFSAQLGAGQLSLYNILKAYSLLDQEVGYCQGLSFVAGVLLLHMAEEDAFRMLKFLMFDAGLRKQYCPDMTILQIQMYQLSRLLHDYHRDLHDHLEEHEIGPSLYAAPWFLTVFASQFPLGFVARVFDLIFLQGTEVIFKVALSLLGSHKPLILQYENLETIVDFIKNTLPNLGLLQMEKTINQVLDMHIGRQLQAYEVEYLVLQDELLLQDQPPPPSQGQLPEAAPLGGQQRLQRLEKANGTLRKQNLELLEELQVANGRIHSLEATIELLLASEKQLKRTAEELERERAALLQTVEELRAARGAAADAEGPTPGPAPGN